MPSMTTNNRRQFLTTAGLTIGAAVCSSSLAPREASAASGSGEPLPFKLGLASYTTRKFSLAETLEMCRRVGLENVCLKSFHLPLDATDEAIKAAVAEVKDAGISLYGGGVISMRDADQAENAFRYAKAAGMSTIVGVPAPEILPLVEKLVKRYDIAVAIHNHGPGDKTYPSPESAYTKIKDLDPRIGLCMYVGHTVRIGADPVEDAERFADRLLDLHLKDVSAAAPEGKTVEIGRGILDIPALLRTLVKIKYSKIASFEYEKDPGDPLPGLAESVGYIRGVLAAIG